MRFSRYCAFLHFIAQTNHCCALRVSHLIAHLRYCFNLRFNRYFVNASPIAKCKSFASVCFACVVALCYVADGENASFSPAFFAIAKKHNISQTKYVH